MKIIVSSDPRDYALTCRGRALQLRDRIIGKKDRETVLGPNVPYLMAPYPERVWQFHKSDRDTWPSRLHGHHSEEPIKLDALTGDLWKIPERIFVGKLKRKELERIQRHLLRSKDLGEKTRLCLPAERVRELED